MIIYSLNEYIRLLYVAYNNRIHSLGDQLGTVDSHYAFIRFPSWHYMPHSWYKFTHTNISRNNEQPATCWMLCEMWGHQVRLHKLPWTTGESRRPQKVGGAHPDLGSLCGTWLVGTDTRDRDVPPSPLSLLRSETIISCTPNHTEFQVFHITLFTLYNLLILI